MDIKREEELFHNGKIVREMSVKRERLACFSVKTVYIITIKNYP